MKPRLRCKHGVWSCASYVVEGVRRGRFAKIGYGYTPKEAYEDWENCQ